MRIEITMNPKFDQDITPSQRVTLVKDMAVQMIMGVDPVLMEEAIVPRLGSMGFTVRDGIYRMIGIVKFIHD